MGKGINVACNYTLFKYMKFHWKSSKESNLSIPLHNPSEIRCIYSIMGYHITQFGVVTAGWQILMHLYWATFLDGKLKAQSRKSY